MVNSNLGIVEDSNLGIVKNKYVCSMSDRQFEKIVEKTMRVYKKLADEHKILSERESLSILIGTTRNATDGFKALLDISGYGFKLDDWTQFEISRVLNHKNNQISVMFHLDILTSVDGWDYNEPENNDQSNRIIKNKDNSIFIEIRNTPYAGGFKPTKTRNNLEDILKKYPGATVYHGYIISKNHKKGVNKVFKLNGMDDNENIREISGDIIYEIVMGNASAFSDTFKALRLCLKENHGFNLTDEDKDILDSYENRIFN